MICRKLLKSELKNVIRAAAPIPIDIGTLSKIRATKLPNSM